MQTCILLHMKIGFPGPPTSNICVMHVPFLHFHSIAVHPYFQSSEHNHHSDFVQFPSAVTEDCFKLYKEQKNSYYFYTSQDLCCKTISANINCFKIQSGSKISKWNTDRRPGKGCGIIYWELKCCTFRQIKKRLSVYIYIRNDFTFTLLQDIKIEGMKSIWIEIMLSNKQKTNQQ